MGGGGGIFIYSLLHIFVCSGHFVFLSHPDMHDWRELPQVLFFVATNTGSS